MEEKRTALIGCCTTLEQLPRVFAAGYDFFVLAGNWLTSLSEEEFARVLEQKEQWPIPCRGINSAIAASVKICGPGFDPKQAQKYASLLCRRAAAIGVELIGIGSPNARGVYGSGSFLREWEETRRFLRIFASTAAGFGMTVDWEPLNIRETSFGVDWTESWDQVRTLREEGIENLGILLDLYHMALQPYPLEDVLPAAPWINHIHIACPDHQAGRRYPNEADLASICGTLRQLAAAGWHSDLSTEVFSGDPYEAGRLLKQGLRWK